MIPSLRDGSHIQCVAACYRGGTYLKPSIIPIAADYEGERQTVCTSSPTESTHLQPSGRESVNRFTLATVTNPVVSMSIASITECIRPSASDCSAARSSGVTGVEVASESFTVYLSPLPEEWRKWSYNANAKSCDLTLTGQP